MSATPDADSLDSPALAAHGLLLRGVFAQGALPERVRASLRAAEPSALDYAQLLLFAHAGPTMWRALRAEAAPAELGTADPVDDFAMRAVRLHLEGELGTTRWAQLYPGPAPVPLQELGARLGWHRPSPLRVGIHPTFGTWFAYRALVAADTSLPPTPLPIGPLASPCDTCVDKPCLGACLGSALSGGTLSLARCVSFRAADRSPCATRCPAREACPVAPEQRYDADQVRYHYGVSLRMIRAAGA